mmetsp:Transcript_8109/g.24096  ORF Transcript_8109/g.24096 Transcript_8109/m.24096 type:complete len:212 (+) Transcript_8109:2504-3139(+)
MLSPWLASCSLSLSSASLYLSTSLRVSPNCPSRRSSCTATCTAPCQSQGSATMVSVLTVHPSRAESLWSISMLVKGGLASWYRALIRKCSTHSTMRDITCCITSRMRVIFCTGSLLKIDSMYCCSRRCLNTATTGCSPGCSGPDPHRCSTLGSFSKRCLYGPSPDSSASVAFQRGCCVNCGAGAPLPAWPLLVLPLALATDAASSFCCRCW